MSIWSDMFHLGIPVAEKLLRPVFISRIRKDRLAKETITMHELERAAHRQGFASLDDIDSAVLEPGGGICFIGKKPTPDTQRHDELLARIDQLSAQITALRA